MHDKPQSADPHAFALPDLSVVQFDGVDAIAFAQAQFMNDVHALEAGQWHWNGWLTPKGRVIALFALLKHSKERLQLLVLDAPGDVLVERLRRLVFRSKVAVSVRGDLQVSGRFAAPASAQARANVFAADGAAAVELDLGAEGGTRTLRVVAGDRAADDDALARWRSFDLEHGLPRLPESQVEQWTPQQLSLERLRGFSVKKGCYPGQEIVARTHFLGKAKRGLALLKSDAPLTVGAQVLADERPVGTVMSVAGYGLDRFALAVLPLDRPSPVSMSGDIRVQETAIKGGLAR